MSEKTLLQTYSRDLYRTYAIQSNVRFRRTEINDWIEKHSNRPRLMSRGKESQ